MATAPDDPCESCDPCVAELVAELEERGWLGLGMHIHDASSAGELPIRVVTPGSPAAQAGLQVFDRVLAIDGKDIVSWEADELEEWLTSVEPGQRLKLRVRREERTFEVGLQARQMSVEALAAALGAQLLRRHVRRTHSEPHSPR